MNKEDITKQRNEIMDEMRSSQIAKEIERLSRPRVEKFIAQNPNLFPEEDRWYGIPLKDLEDLELREAICKLNPMISTYYKNIYVLALRGESKIETLIKTHRISGELLTIDDETQPLYQQKGETVENEVENYFPQSFCDVRTGLNLFRSGPVLYRHITNSMIFEYEGYRDWGEKVDIKLIRIYEKGLVLHTWKAVEQEQAEESFHFENHQNSTFAGE